MVKAYATFSTVRYVVGILRVMSNQLSKVTPYHGMYRLARFYYAKLITSQQLVYPTGGSDQAGYICAWLRSVYLETNARTTQ